MVAISTSVAVAASRQDEQALRLEFDKRMEENDRLQELERERKANSKYKNPDNYDSTLVKNYIRFAKHCERLVDSNSFNAWIILVIIIAGVIVGLQTYSRFENDVTIGAIDSIILGIFTFEVILKICAEACAPWIFFLGPEKGWNIFDLFIVFLSMPFWTFGGGNSVKLLRLTRLMRVMKLLKKVPQLQMIVMGLVGGLKSIVYILVLLLLVFYIYAVAGVTLFRENDMFHFRSVPVSIVTLFRMATLEDWTDIMYLNYYGCDSDRYDTSYLYFAYQDGCPQGMKDKVVDSRGITVAYCVSFVVIASMVMLSLFVGAVTMSMTESMTAMKLESELNERRRRMAKAKKRAEKELESKRSILRASQRGSDDKVDIDQEDPKYTEKQRKPNSPLAATILANRTRQLPPLKEKKGSDEGEFDEGEGEERQAKKRESMMQFNDEQLNKVKGILNVLGSKQNRQSAVFPEDSNESVNKPRFKELARSALKKVKNSRRTSLMWNPFAQPPPPREEQERVRAAFRGAWEGIDLLDLLDDHVELEYDMYFKKKWARFSQFCVHIIENEWFNNFMIVVILIASAIVGLQTEPAFQEGPKGILLDAIDWAVSGFFLLEIILKMAAERFHPWRYFLRYGQIQGWNIFDYLVVCVSFIPGSLRMLNMLRLLRLLRVFKLVKSLPALQVIIVALIGGLTSITYIGIILFMVFYVFAILGMILFQESDPWQFGSLHISLFTLFRMATLEDWSDVLYISMYGCDKYGYISIEHLCVKPVAYGPIAAIFFISFVLLGALVLMTLFVGVVTTSMEQATRRQESEREFNAKLEDLKAKHGIGDKAMSVYEKLFDMLDLDGSGTIEEEELRLGLESIGKCPAPAELSRMVKLVDEDGSGEIDMLEFVLLLSVISKYNGGSVMYQPDFRIRKSLLIKQDSDASSSSAPSSPMHSSIR